MLQTPSVGGSKIVSLIGPIEHWWDTEDDPYRFMSLPAIEYRAHRIELSGWLVSKGYLVYRAHEAFKGPWDDRAQKLNDFGIEISDIIINMSPPGIPGAGTAREAALAETLLKPVIAFPPRTSYQLLESQLNLVAVGLEL